MLVRLIAVALVLLTPLSVSAQLTCTVGTFGAHTTESSLVAFPIGVAECDLEIPITFVGLTPSATSRFVDVWRGTGAARCELATTRTDIASSCSVVTLPIEQQRYVDAPVTLTFSPRQLFGDCVTDARTFFFFDVAAVDDTSATFASGTFCEVSMVLDATPPDAPTLPRDFVGDQVLDLTWTSSPLPPTTASVYFDGAGCASADAGASSVLVAGGSAPHANIVGRSDGAGSTTLSTSALGWPPCTYGQRGALAITLTDTAGNEGRLSNVVCVTHVALGTDESCAPSPSSGCGCSAHGRVGGWLAPCALALGLRMRRRLRAPR